ncbi:MAG TPA: malonate decarboxylase subunit epsilon [Terracidiphilus sp.]|nr:malonate decarboxylase subunit epsilon [Terracidiphilus sp.]
MSIAFLFPGQGSQRPGMLRALPDHPQVQATLEEAGEVLKRDVRQLDEEKTLESTITTQIAIFIAGIASARALIAEGVGPDFVAGLSVGAYTAAVIGGALGFSDGLRLVRKRAELTAERFPSGYGLAAIVGLQEQTVAKLVVSCTTPEHPAYLALLNAPQQMVVAGSIEALDRVLAEARKAGCKKAERLAVRIPSHCALFEDVAQQMMEAMRSLEPRAPQATYVMNRTARPTKHFDRIREDVATNIAYPVRWHDSTEVLVEMGAQLFIEMHPGQVLTRLASAGFPQVRTIALEASSLAQTVRIAKAARRSAID